MQNSRRRCPSDAISPSCLVALRGEIFFAVADQNVCDDADAPESLGWQHRCGEPAPKTRATDATTACGAGGLRNLPCEAHTHEGKMASDGHLQGCFATESGESDGSIYQVLISSLGLGQMTQ